MFNQRPMSLTKAFEGEVLIASGTADSEPIDLREIAQNFNFSVHYIITGTGTLKIEYLICSTKDGTYLDIGTDIGATLGAGSSILPFAADEPVLAPWMKIRITEDGGANGVTVDVNLNVQ
ncbi:MAG: hypothetical protein BBJ57_07230 [Desulfobacterales bacterium PC51MH44]|nr:MAG: hypothetical protein BBJ57_07230 [Desulfobacterales bacterium PC51MH44]